MKELLSLLNNIHPVSLPLKQFLSKKLQSRIVARREFLLEAGHISRHIYFIKKGLLRSYYEEDGQQVCSKFMKEGDIIVSVISFFKQRSSYEFIQAIEECEVYSICYDELQYIYKNFPEFNIMGRVLVTKYYLLAEQRLYFMRKKKAPERYQMMLKHFPKLILRVPAKYIASYLGISKETLSRIRGGKY